MLNSRHNGTRIRRERKRERGKEACSCAREREPEYAGTRCHMRSEIFDHVMISTACKGEVEYLIPVSLLPSLSPFSSSIAPGQLIEVSLLAAYSDKYNAYAGLVSPRFSCFDSRSAIEFYLLRSFKMENEDEN